MYSTHLDETMAAMVCHYIHHTLVGKVGSGKVRDDTIIANWLH